MNSQHFRRPAIGTGLLLLVPLVMTFLDRDKPAGDGWRWGPGSFVVMGALLFAAGVLYEWLANRAPKAVHKALVAGAIAGLVVLIWAELAVDAVSRGLRLLLG